MVNTYSENVSISELIFKLKSWFKYLLSKVLYIIAFTLLGALVGVVYSIFSKEIYTAKTTFVLEEGDRSAGGLLGQYGGLASMVGVDIGGAGGNIFQGDNIIELYKSRLMIQRTLLAPVGDNPMDGKRLINLYLDLKQGKDAHNLRNSLNFSTDPKRFSRVQDSILQLAVDDLNKRSLSVTKPNKKLSIIEVEVKSKDELFAKSFNEQMVKTVNDFYVQTKTKKALKNLAILQHQTDSVRAVLYGAINSAAAVSDATPNLNSTRQILRTSGERSRFNAEANKAILTQLVQNLELAKISLRKETPLIQVIDSPVYPLKKQKIGIVGGFFIGAFITFILTVIILTLKKISL
jgi:uncharacterized protein involved in exopolysaccharide biosynthesis